MKRRQYLGSMAGIGAASVLGTTAVAADSGTTSVGTIEDPSGDDNGPGGYTYPTADQLPEGCFDVKSVDIVDTGSHWKLTYHMGKVPNSFDADAGFSTQVFQLYVRDPNAPDGAPTSVQGRKGMTSRFLQSYHYRVHVTSGKQVLEQPASGDGDPKVLAKDFSASGDSDKNTVTISIPKEHFQTTDFTKLKTALLVFSQDGFGKGGIRQGFAEEAAQWKFGGANPDAIGNAPRVIDLVAPDAVVDQKQALSYSADSPATIPLTKAGTLINGKESGTGSGDSTSISDPEGDDYGPGSYTYPTTDQLPEGCFDAQGVDVADTDSHWKLTYHMGKVPNSFSSDAGFSTQVFQLYIQDPNAPDDAPTSVQGRKGMTSTFQQAYHYRVHVTSGKQVLEQPASGDGDPKVLAKDFSASGDSDKNTVTISIPKEHFQTKDFSKLKTALLVFSQDGFGKGGIRQGFAEEAAQWKFGGVNPDAVGNAPRVIDLVAPDAVVDQKKALSYSADSTATIPLTKAEYLLKGMVPQTGVPKAFVDPGPTIFTTQEATLNASNSKDPKGQKLTYSWTQTDGPSVNIENADTAKPTVMAPKFLSEETQLTFEVTVTDPDGNSDSATTNVTVQPQSMNDAPIAKTDGSRMVEPGDTIVLNGSKSKDPNGGTLTFHWEQVAGPEVELNGADSPGPALTVPDVDTSTAMTFELTVSDGQGKSDTATTEVVVNVESTTTPPPTTTESNSNSGGGTTETSAADSNNNGSGSGPGFGTISSLVGIAGGAAYAGKRRLLDDEADE